MGDENSADLIVINGDIRTMDPLQPRAGAIAISGDRILAMGSDAEVSARKSRQTKVIDAGGRLILPGLQDTHIHLQDSGADHVLCVDLEAAKTVEDLQGRLKAHAAKQSGEGWLKGVGWYAGIFDERNLSRGVLDAVSPDRPMFLVASDGHSAAINTKACSVLGISAATADPPNGKFVREADGFPQGLVYEDAIDLVRKKMPSPSDADYAAGVRFGQALCNRHGITGVLDALVEERHMRVYRGLENANELSLRVAATARVFPRSRWTGRLRACSG